MYGSVDNNRDIKDVTKINYDVLILKMNK